MEPIERLDRKKGHFPPWLDTFHLQCTYLLLISIATGHPRLLSFFFPLSFMNRFWNAFAISFSSFAAARFFAGFNGAVGQTLPAAIIADTVEPKWRGTATALCGVCALLVSLCGWRVTLWAINRSGDQRRKVSSGCRGSVRSPSS